MKYLQDYQESEQTALFNKCGAFFAFSQSQFDEAKKEGINYVSLGAGLICPKENAKELVKGLDRVYKEAIKKDLKENGKKAIIERELFNHECFYTGSIEDCVEKLSSYPITEDEIKAVYLEVRPTLSEDYF